MQAELSHGNGPEGDIMNLLNLLVVEFFPFPNPVRMIAAWGLLDIGHMRLTATIENIGFAEHL